MKHRDLTLRRVTHIEGDIMGGRAYLKRLQLTHNARLEDLQDYTGVTIQELSRLRMASNLKPNAFTLGKLCMTYNVTPCEMLREFGVWDGDSRLDELYHLLSKRASSERSRLIERFLEQAKETSKK